MDDEKNDRRNQAIALFRYGLIADVVNWPPGQRGCTPSSARRLRTASTSLLAAHARGGGDDARLARGVAAGGFDAPPAQDAR